MPTNSKQAGYKFVIALVLGAGCSRQAPSTDTLPGSQPAKPAAATRPKATPTPTPGIVRKLNVYLPGRDGKLHETELPEPDDLVKKRFWEPESALALLFRKAPEIIPPGTRLTHSVRKNMNYPDPPGTKTVFEVSLNPEFLTSPLWRDKKKARLAFDAIVQTARSGVYQAILPTYPTIIHVVVDGKTIRKLGKLQVKNPVWEYEGD